MVPDGLPSQHSRRADERALPDYFHRRKGGGRQVLTAALCGHLGIAAGLMEVSR